MAPFDRNIVRWLALPIVLNGVFISCVAQTEPSNVCISDTLACRYDCPPESIQEHCGASEKEKDGYYYPGHFRTNLASCQVCPDVHFMPDVNNCCECLLCSECEGTNNTIMTRCGHTNHTSDTVCTIQDDPPSRAPNDCPWMESTTTTTDTKKATDNTPSDPQGSKSEGTVNVYMVLFYIWVGIHVLLLICCCLCCCLCRAYHSGGTDESDANNKIERTWTDVGIIVAEKIRRTCAACRAACQPANQPETQTGNGSQSATQTGTGSQSATPTGTGSQPATPTGTGSQPATPTGTGSQPSIAEGSQHSDTSHDETDALLARGNVPQKEENQREQTTSV